MDLQVFNYDQSKIRTHINEKGEMYFVAKDICDILEISNHRDAISRLDEDERASVLHDGLSFTAINESGLYTLIIRSNKDEAKKFRKWITSEVLPSIRKTGSYTAPTKKDQMSLIKIRKETQAAIELAEMFGVTGNQAKLSGMNTMSKYYGIDVKSITEITHLISESQEKILTPTEIGKQLGISSRKVNLRLQELDLQKKIGDSWSVTEEGKKYSVMLDTVKKHSNGTPIQQIKWKESVIELLKMRVAA